MLALRTSPPSLRPAEGERIARDVYGLAVSARALPGERDCNFRLRSAGAQGVSTPGVATQGVASREFVLKIQDVAADAASADCLVCVLDHLTEQDPTLPVPRLFPTQRGDAIGRYHRDGVDYATCLVSYLPGRLLGESPPSAPLLHDVGAQLARLDRALQGFFHPSLNRRLAWDVRRLPELAEFSGQIETVTLREAVVQVASYFKAGLPRLRGLRSQAIHGDCHGNNLLVSPDGESICGILDFGDMIHAPLILEPAVTMSELMTGAVAPLDSVATVLHGYARNHPLVADEVELLYDLITARHAVTLLVHAWRRHHDPNGARMLDQAAVHAGHSLLHLTKLDRAALTQAWHGAAGTQGLAILATAAAPASPITDLARRQRLMGAGAELFYETPLHIVRGAGVWMYDSQGRAYLDVYNNVPHVGHAHPAVVAAIQAQAAVLATHTRYLHEGILDYAQELTARLPAHLNACLFVNSGSEANDVAWRIAKMATGHEGAMVMDHAYHGITDSVAMLTPGTGQPRDLRVVTIAAPTADSMIADAARGAETAIATLRERAFAPAAFFMDSALTSSGIFDPPAAWAAAVTACVRAAGGLIVADEVQYGLGRSGSHFWGFERRGLEPDIVTLGKPVANGYPMGVVIANRALIEAFQAKYGFFSTFGGNAVAAAAALAVLRVLDREQLMMNALVTGDYLAAQLVAMAARHPGLGAVRGKGLLLGLQVRGRDVAAAKRHTLRIVNTLASRHRVLIGHEGPRGDILKLRPPLPFRAEHADLLVQAIDAAAAEVDT